MGGFYQIVHCVICGEGELRQGGAKYCGNCSPIFFRIKRQAGFQGKPIDDLYKATKEMRKLKTRSPCGRKPKHIRIRTEE